MKSFRNLVLLIALVGVPALAFGQPVTQPFSFSNLGHNLPMLRHGSISWGDIDGDLDLDVFLSGESEAGIETGIYINEGRGADGKAVFTKLSTSITAVVYSFSSWADVDGDSDLDLLVAGSTNLTFPYSANTTLYRNDGNGAFSAASAGFPGLHSGSASWGDLDKDGDLDLILTGVQSSDEAITVLAINQGGFQFTLNTDALPAVSYGDTVLGDLDKDGDLDLVLSGSSATGFTTKQFTNNNGVFTAGTAELGALGFSSVDLGDYDSDGDLDLIISGGAISVSLMDGEVRLLQNNNGVLTPVAHAFEGVLAGDATWGDYDNDGDVDLLFVGATQVFGKRNARIYRNDGGGTFVNSSNLIGSLFTDVEWGDFDADGDLDLMSSGFTPYGQSTTNIYENRRQVRPAIPSTPSGLASRVTDGSVELNWTQPIQNDPTNTSLSYNVLVGTTPGGSDIVSAMADRATGWLRSPRPGNASSLASFKLENLENGTYYWSVQAINNALIASPFAIEGVFSISGAFATDAETAEELPTKFALKGSYPNPFSSTAHIEFDIPAPTGVTLRIYSILGQEVARISAGVLSAGTHRLDWSGLDATGQRVGSGIYLYELRAGSNAETGSVTLVR